MKNKIFGLMVALFCFATVSNAQVSVTATAGTTGPTSYTTLNSAFSAINAGTHQGVISIVISANTTEPSTSVPLLKSGGTSSYTLISIMPSGNVTVNSAATPTASRGVIELHGADNVIIDGDDPLTAGTQNLTFQVATNASTGTAAIRLASTSTTGADGADNNTIKNCIIIGGRNSATSTTVSYGINFSNSSSITTGAYSSLNTVIENNLIKRAHHGIYINGASSTYPNTGTIIRNNVIGDAISADNIGSRGILITYSATSTSGGTATIEGNDIRVGDYGATGYNATIAGVEVGTNNYGIKIIRNSIHDINQPVSGGYGAHGIYITGSANNTLSYIQNNFIRDCKMVVYQTSATSTFIPTGIFLTAGATNINLDNNTIVMNSQLGSGSNFSSFCVDASVSGVTFASIQNNIFVNNHSSTSAYGVYCAGTANISSGIINYNNYYCPNANVGYYNAAARTSLANWQTATSKDANSLNVNPAFVSSTDLHIDTSVVSYLESAGDTVLSVINDIDGQVRPGPVGSINGGALFYDIGADEFDGNNPNICSGTPLVPVASSSVTSSCGTSNTVLSASGYSTGMGLTYQWKNSSVSGGPYITIPGATSSIYSATGVSATTYYVLETVCSYSADTSISNEASFTIIPNTNASVLVLNNTLCQGDSTVIRAFPRGNGETYSWNTGSTADSIIVKPNVTAEFGVAVTATNTCVTSASAPVTVNPTPLAVASVNANSFCGGLPANFTGAPATSGITTTIINATFNSGNEGFSTLNNSIGGTTANAAWTLRPASYNYTGGPVTFTSNDNSQFFLSNSDEQGSSSTLTSTVLQTPSFSTVGYTSLNLSFYHYFRYQAGDPAALVEISTDGTNWNQLLSYSATTGAPTAFASAATNLNSYLNQPTVYVRFKFEAAWGYYWAIDNVLIQGEEALDYAWSGPNTFSATTKDFAIPSVDVNNAGTYTLTVSNGYGCGSSDSVAITVTPNVGASVDITADTICNGETLTIKAYPRGNGETYSWSNGNLTDEITVNPSTTSVYTVWVTGTNTCVTYAVSNVKVNQTPVVDVALDNDTMCAGSAANFTGAPSTNITLLNANFNSGNDGFIEVNNSTGGVPASANWILRPASYVYTADPSTFTSNDNSQFFLSNSDEQGSGSTTATILTSPAFSTIGLTSANLSFYHYYRHVSGSVAAVEVSTNGTNWTNLTSYTATVGASTGFVNASVNLNAYINQPTVYVRFKYDAAWGYYWAIDNVVVSGVEPLTYAWSGPSNYSASTKDISLTSTSASNSGMYTLNVSNQFGCSSSDSVRLVVNANPTVVLPDYADVCDTIQEILLNTATPAGGVYSGNGVIFSVSDYFFDVANGSSTIKYVYTTPEGCSDSAQKTITVNASSKWYLDNDGDGHGDVNTLLIACTPEAGYVADSTDCNDNDVNIYAPIVYYLDNDGDGYGSSVDSTIACSLTAPNGYVANNLDCNDGDINVNPLTIWYEDVDGDTYGNANSFVLSCTHPIGYVSDNTDCDDTDGNIFPTTVWYLDADGDGYGDANTSQVACVAPNGYVLDATDCNDGDIEINPTTVWYLDSDGDGYGDVNNDSVSCDTPAGYVLNSTDCDDSNVLVYNAAIGGIFSITDATPCAGENFTLTVNGTQGTIDWVYSTDNGLNWNSLGNADSIYTLSIPNSGSPALVAAIVTYAGCLNDTSNAIEVEVLENKTWYADADGDGYGDLNTALVDCNQPLGYVADSTDCNDGDININPLTVWFNDADGDGYGDISSSDTGCVSGLSNPVLNSNDCDDNDVNTGVATTVYYADLDGDGFINNADSVASCSQPVGYVLASSSFGNDCDDNNDTLFISGTYYIDMDGDGYDNGMTTICRGSSIPAGYLSSTAGSDCDDNDDQVTIATEYFYADADGDMYVVADSVLACSAPTGYISLSSALGSDCDDNDDQVTAATEYFYADADGDMYITADSVLACTAPTGYISFSNALGSDCDDDNSNVHNGSANANFTVDSSNDPTVVFNADDLNQTTYSWYIDFQLVGSGNPFSYTFTIDHNYDIALVTEGPCGVKDSVVKTILVSNTSINSINKNAAISIAPNPANTFVNITAKGLTEASVQLVNMNGQLISELKADFGTVNVIKINTTDLVNGVYFVKVSSNNFNSISKLFITR